MQAFNIAKQIQLLLDSDLTAYRIGKDSNVPVSVVQRLKSGERSIDKLSVKTAQALIDYSYKVLKHG
ncbi:hypothetical protein D1831_08175 [Lactiplantibacillus garii]|uniref:HTH cro/C1-type domain-containing protein n=1 Tax=Lactiplantibacillus garii TaxID=2306423 RepID=A0A3R8KE97_9LACO|nr:hypothetical protein D1831_08175 [Lactiplantibacillus garii]